MHDNIRDRLARVLERVNGTSATVEPRVLKPEVGDIKVSKYGSTWVLDVGVVCLGPSAASTRAATPPRAWQRETYAAFKAAKYAGEDNFIPFILETGGLVNNAARE
jgi:hypothetical protein